MVTNLINGEHAFTELADEWDALVQRSMTNTPFQLLSYQRAWWTHLHPSDGSLHTITVRDQAGALQAIGCFYLVDDVIYFNGCVEETDYLDLITPAEQADRIWTAVLNCMDSPGFPQWQAIDLCNVPAASPTRAILAQQAAERGFSFAEEIHEVCPIIHLASTFDDYLQGIDSKQRREINRKLRRAKGANAKLIVVGPEDELEQAVDQFLDLLQKSTYAKEAWLNDGRRAMFHETAQAAMAAGILQLLFIEVNGQKAAALFNFDYNDRVWVYNSGLDPSQFGGLSLGVVVTARAIELAIENGRSVFDFLRGNETYKYRFGAEDTEIFRIHLARS